MARLTQPGAQDRPRLTVNTAIRVIGLGGVGSIVTRYLTVFLASLGVPCRLVLVDGDAFAPENTGRMLFSHLGNKAEVTAHELDGFLEDSPVSLVAIPEYLDRENIGRLVTEGDHVLLAVDNHGTRRLVIERCAALREVTLVSGGNDGVGPDSGGYPRRGTYGDVQVYLRRDGEDVTAPPTRFHPEIAEANEPLPSEEGCAQTMVSVPQLLFTNLQTAAAMLNTYRGVLCENLGYEELAFDTAEALMRPVRLRGDAPVRTKQEAG